MGRELVFRNFLKGKLQCELEATELKLEEDEHAGCSAWNVVGASQVWARLFVLPAAGGPRAGFALPRGSLPGAPSHTSSGAPVFSILLSPAALRQPLGKFSVLPALRLTS